MNDFLRKITATANGLPFSLDALGPMALYRTPPSDFLPIDKPKKLGVVPFQDQSKLDREATWFSQTGSFGGVNASLIANQLRVWSGLGQVQPEPEKITPEMNLTTASFGDGFELPASTEEGYAKFMQLHVDNESRNKRIIALRARLEALTAEESSLAVEDQELEGLDFPPALLRNNKDDRFLVTKESLAEILKNNPVLKDDVTLAEDYRNRQLEKMALCDRTQFTPQMEAYADQEMGTVDEKELKDLFSEEEIQGLKRADGNIYLMDLNLLDVHEKAEAKIGRANDSEKPFIQKTLDIQRTHNIRQKERESNAAVELFNKAVLNNAYLRSRSVGPLEYQILRAHWEVDAPEAKWRATTPRHARRQIQTFLRRGAYLQEARYVDEFMSHRITRMIRQGCPENQWKVLEREQREIRDLYKRLSGTGSLNVTDFERLRTVRAKVFPYSIDWQKTFRYERPDPKTAVKGPKGELPTLQQAEEDFLSSLQVWGTASRAYELEAAGAAIAEMDKAELVSVEREQADFKFQKIRLRKEFLRIRLLAKANGAELEPEEIADWEKALKTYDDKYNDYVPKWKDLIEGKDPKLREHDRNANDKNVLVALLHGTQHVLYNLYEKYGKFTTEDGKKDWVRPSCLSLSYNNQVRLMADAVERLNGESLNRKNIERLYRPIWQIFGGILDEIGLRIPGTNTSLIKGRNPPDVATVDSLGARQALTTSGNEKAQFVLFGADGSYSMMRQTPPHPDLANVAGAENVMDKSAVFSWDAAKQCLVDRNGYEFYKEDLMHWAMIYSSNHSGAAEFVEMPGLAYWGIHLAQQAQKGVSYFPPFGDYLMVRAIIIDRSEGSNAANDKFIEFMNSMKSALTYASGTRMTTPRGGHPYLYYGDNPAMHYVYRLATDSVRSGQTTKIVWAWQDMVRPAGQAFMDTHAFFTKPVIHTTSTRSGENSMGVSIDGTPGIATANLTHNHMTGASRNIEKKFGFASAISSSGIPTREEFRKSQKGLFKKRSSERADQIRAYKAAESPQMADQRHYGNALDLVTVKKMNPASIKRREELARMSPQERKESEVEIRDHMERRADRIRSAQQLWKDENRDRPLSKRDEVIAQSWGLEIPVDPAAVEEKGKPEKREAELMSQETRTALMRRAGVTERELREILVKANVRVDPSRPDNEKALLAFEECALRSLLSAQEYRERGFGEYDAEAWDWDNTTKDGAFPVSIEKIEKLAKDWGGYKLGGPAPSEEMREMVNIFPFVLVRMAAYRQVMNHAPIIATTTTAFRWKALARKCPENKMVETFFRILTGVEEGTPLNMAMIEKAIETDYRIGTREKIVRHIESLEEAFRKNSCRITPLNEGDRPDFTHDEQEDIRLIVESGDAHLKYRSQYSVPYLNSLLSDAECQWESAEKAPQNKAAHVEWLVDRLEEAREDVWRKAPKAEGYDLKAALEQDLEGEDKHGRHFTDQEKAHLRIIQGHRGYSEEALAECLPYQVLFDDRNENVSAAARYRSCTVYQLKNFEGPGRLHLYGDGENDRRQRIEDGRRQNARVFEMVRHIGDEEMQGRVVIHPKEDAPKMIPGVADQPIEISYSSAEVQREWFEMDQRAAGSKDRMRAAILHRTPALKKEHDRAKLEISDIYVRHFGDPRRAGFKEIEVPNAEDSSVKEVLIFKKELEVALDLLDPRERNDIKDPSDFESVELVLRALEALYEISGNEVRKALGPDIERVKSLIDQLRERDALVLARSFSGKPAKSIFDYVGKIGKLAGSAAKLFGFASSGAKATGTTLQNAVQDEFKEDAKPMTLLKRVINPLHWRRYVPMYVALGRLATGKKYLVWGKMTTSDQTRAFGKVVKELGERYAAPLHQAIRQYHVDEAVLAEKTAREAQQKLEDYQRDLDQKWKASRAAKPTLEEPHQPTTEEQTEISALRSMTVHTETLKKDAQTARDRWINKDEFEAVDEIKAYVRVLQGIIETVGSGIDGVTKAQGDLKKVAGSLMKARGSDVVRSIAGALLGTFRRMLNEKFQEVELHQRAQAEELARKGLAPELPHMNEEQQGLYDLLGGWQKTFEGTPLEGFLELARDGVARIGLEDTARVLWYVPERIQEISGNKTAMEVAAILTTSSDERSTRQAVEVMTTSALMMMKADSDTAIRKLRLLTEAVWYHGLLRVMNENELQNAEANVASLQDQKIRNRATQEQVDAGAAALATVRGRHDQLRDDWTRKVREVATSVYGNVHEQVPKTEDQRVLVSESRLVRGIREMRRLSSNDAARQAWREMQMDISSMDMGRNQTIDVTTEWLARKLAGEQPMVGYETTLVQARQIAKDAIEAMGRENSTAVALYMLRRYASISRGEPDEKILPSELQMMDEIAQEAQWGDFSVVG
jgi:hypothetical protein